MSAPSPARPEPARIAVQDLHLSIEGRAILHGLSFATDAARIGVVGRNGSGKSTLARLLAGLVAPTSGQVRVNGRDLARDRRAALVEVGLMFQNPDHQILFPTVAEELAFGLTQLGQPRARAAEGVRAVLARFGVAHWHDAQVATLSQGQKHLVCLMALVAMAPRMLILDEPFAGLDIPTRAQLRRALAQYDGTVVHVSHDPDDLRDHDHLLWIDQGRLRAEGPAGPVLAEYLAEMARLGERDDLADLAG